MVTETELQRALEGFKGAIVGTCGQHRARGDLEKTSEVRHPPLRGDAQNPSTGFSRWRQSDASAARSYASPAATSPHYEVHASMIGTCAEATPNTFNGAIPGKRGSGRRLTRVRTLSEFRLATPDSLHTEGTHQLEGAVCLPVRDHDGEAGQTI